MIKSTDEYRFYFNFNSVSYAVSPIFDKLKWSWKKDGFRYSKECKTEFTFMNDPKNSQMDFNLLLGIENGVDRCNQILFVITRTCDRGLTATEYWRGSFSINDGEFNLNRCTYTVTMNVIDKYSCLNSTKAKKINVLDTPILTIKSEHQDVPSAIEFYTCFDGFCDPTSVERGTLVYTNNYTVDNITLAVKPLLVYASEFIETNDIAGAPQRPSSDTAWVQLTSISGVTSWIRPYVGGDMSIAIKQVGWSDPAFPEDCPNEFPVPDTITDFTPYKSIFSNYSFYGYDYPFNGIFYPDSGHGPIRYQCQNLYYALPTRVFTRFHTVYNSLLYIINQACPDITGLVSDFFEWNPPGNAPGYVAGINYVTGMSNVVTNLAMSYKADVAIVHPDEYATIGMTTFDSLMSSLQTIFNVDWFIDNSGRVRIEHIKYFSSVLGHNSTVSPHARWNEANKIYSYNKQEMPNTEVFSFEEQQSVDFVGLPIVYSGSCVVDDSNSDQSGQKEYAVSGITTDLNYIDNYPSNINNAGFVMVVFEDNGANLMVHKEIGKLTGVLINNAHLSWANLHYNYHRYGRVLLQGNMNGVNETFFTANPIKIQKDVKLNICCGDEFDPTGILIQTGIGIGEVETADQQDNIITMQINL